MLPCNIIVQEISDGQVEGTAIEPLASLQAIKNPALKKIAAEISNKLKTVIDRVFISGMCTGKRMNGTE
jgi:uncharacterized protein (DUF302 family)